MAAIVLVIPLLLESFSGQVTKAVGLREGRDST
jgi:hypothetical protein